MAQTMEITDLRGRVLIGNFKRAEQMTRKDGSTVPGMFKLTITVNNGAREWDHRLVYFDTDQGGEPTAISQQMEAAPPSSGDLVAVKFRSRASVNGAKGYVDDTATAITILGL